MTTYTRSLTASESLSRIMRSGPGSFRCWGNFVCAKNLSRSLSHALFHLPTPITNDRRPDVAFVSYERWAKNRPLPFTDAWDVIPNLAVEVVSPTDKADEIEQRIAEYFRAGVQLVWVVYPTWSKIHVYQSPTQISVRTRADFLDGGAVVPGFKLALAELFTETVDASAAANGSGAEH